MSEISELFANNICSNMQRTAAPLFTVLSKTRVELSGPVICRWFSKIYAFLDQEFADETGLTFAISSPLTWRVPIWISALWLKGYRATTNIKQADIVVGTDLNILSQAAQNGSLALALPTGALDYQCSTNLPTGVLDANQEVAAFPDVLEIPAPGLPANFDLEENISVKDLFQQFAQVSASTRVAIHETQQIFSLTAQIFSLWNQQAHVILVTKESGNSAETNQKLRLEKIDVSLPKISHEKE